MTVTAGLLALIYGITTAGRSGWGDPVALATLTAFLVLLVAFYLIERRSPAPLASVRVLARPTVKWGNLGGLTAFSMGSGVVFLLTLYLQNQLRFSPLVTGLMFGVPGIAAVVAGLVAPRFIERFGARSTLVAGLVVQALMFSVLLATGVSRTAGVVLVLVACGVGFFGHICALVAYTVTATSGLPDSEQGLATGLTTMTQQVGITVGIPILNAVATARTAALRPSESATAAAIGGLHAGILTDVALTVVVAVLIGFFLRRAAGGAAGAAGAEAAGVAGVAEEVTIQTPLSMVSSPHSGQSAKLSP